MTNEAYLHAPHILHDPGPDYADRARAFQGIPTLEIAPSGRLWAAWYGGGTGEDRHNYVLVATKAETDGSWQAPRLVIDPDGEGPVRAYDPCLWHDPAGRLWLFWAQGYEGHSDERAGVWAMTTEQSDAAAPAWSVPRRICDGIMMNKPTVLSTGEWLLPVARWRQDGSAQAIASPDAGTRFSLIGAANVPVAADRNCDEHMIVELADGRLWMLVRTIYGIGESVSSDRGRRWSAVRPSSIPHPTSRFFIRRLLSGTLLLVKHGEMDSRTGRSHLQAFLSEDDGVSWKGGLMLDERNGVSYPDGVQTADGTLLVIYDYDRKGSKEILMARFTESDVLARDCVSGTAAFRLPVNKATGVRPSGT